MFPYPIEKQPILNQYRYRIFLYLSIITWLLPLIAIMLISVRSLSDLNAGNYWGVNRINNVSGSGSPQIDDPNYPKT